MKKQYYLDIKTKLKATIGNSSITPEYLRMQHFDLWNEQVQDIRASKSEGNNQIPFKFPCIFMEITPIKWQSSDISGSMKLGNCVFRFHIVQQIMTELTGAQEARVLQQFDFVESVNAVLQGFQTANFDVLDKSGEVIDHNHDSIREDIIDYTVTVFDGSKANTIANSTHVVTALTVDKDETLQPHPSAVGSKFTI
jgi:hypothetical protein